MSIGDQGRSLPMERNPKNSRKTGFPQSECGITKSYFLKLTIYKVAIVTITATLEITFRLLLFTLKKVHTYKRRDQADTAPLLMKWSK